MKNIILTTSFFARYNEDSKLVGMDVYINGEKQ
jgi:hypothetical protein